MKYVKKKASFPPLGLLTVRPLLPDDFEVKLVDLNVRKLKDKDILWADMVFISAMEVQKESVKDVVKRCRELGRTTVGGGPLFTIGFDDMEGVDHMVLDEAETTLGPFLKDLKEGKLKKVYTSKVRPDIKRSPPPDWTLIKPKKYTTMLLQYSRGCPHNCEFCNIPYLNGRVPRTKAPDQVLRELDSLYELGWRGGVFFVDDNFIGNRVEVKRMLPELIGWQKEHRYPFTFLTEASVNLADDSRLMELMRDANFDKVFLGIETPNMESLKECNKVQNLKRDLTEVVKTIQGYGMEVMGGFIVGFDHDTENIFQNQIDFIQSTGIVTAMVGLLNAIPKTPLWERLEREGRITNMGETAGSNTDGTINFEPRMKRDELLEGYKRIISTIYSPKEYYKRIDTFLKNYKPSVKARFRIGNLRPFLRSVWRIGIVSRARFYYWKMVIKTLAVRRKAFPKAIELAIAGHHFQKVARIVASS